MLIEKQELINVFKKYSNLEWQNWIDDILMTGYAVHISSFTPDTDVLSDMMLFLNQSDIDTISYERALDSSIDRYVKEDKFTERVFRLIDSLIIIKDAAVYKSLYNLFTEKNYYNRVFENDLLVTKILQNLTFKKNIPQSIKNGIKDKGYEYFQNSLTANAGFCQNFISYIREQFGIENAYMHQSDLLENEQIIFSGNHLLKQKYSTIIKDKAREYLRFNGESFFENAYDWVFANYTSFKNKYLFRSFLESLQAICLNPIYKKEEIKSREVGFYKKLQLLLSVYFNSYDNINKTHVIQLNEIFNSNKRISGEIFTSQYLSLYLKFEDYLPSDVLKVAGEEPEFAINNTLLLLIHSAQSTKAGKELKEQYRFME